MDGMPHRLARSRGVSHNFQNPPIAVPILHNARNPKPYPMKRLLILAPLLVAACQTTPISGKKSFNIFSVQDDCELGTSAYAEFTAGETLITTNKGNLGTWKKSVENAMNRLASVAEQQGFAYEVKLIQDDQTVNAWCLPCGKMAVYTGILPVCEDETGLAAVMGHEIGHAIARHGTQRMSTDTFAQMGLELLNNPDYAQYGALAYDVLVSKPYGRDQELEADHIGLILMARAGYDPRAATEFWKRMDALGSSSVPEFLSTHPSNAKRIAQLEELMPDALAIYQGLQPK